MADDLTNKGWPERFADCAACGDTHPEGVLEDGLCPACTDTRPGIDPEDAPPCFVCGGEEGEFACPICEPDGRQALSQEPHHD